MLPEIDINKLKFIFKLNQYEAKVWLALLAKGISTAGELSDISNVPRSRTYDILESLEKKGFVVMKLGKPVRYIALNPQDVLAKLKTNILDQTKDKINELDQIKNTDLFNELDLLYKNKFSKVDSDTLTGILKNKKSTLEYIKKIIQNSEKNVSFVISEQDLAKDFSKIEESLKKAARNKKVKFKIITDSSDSSQKMIQSLKKYAKIKVHPELNSRFIISDSKEVVFTIHDPENVHESNEESIWVSSPYFAQALETLFKNSWAKAKEV